MTKVKFHGQELTLRWGVYPNGRKSLQLVDSDGMPYCTASINLPEEDLEEGSIFIKNYSENLGVVKALREAGVIKMPLYVVPCGFNWATACSLAHKFV